MEKRERKNFLLAVCGKTISQVGSAIYTFAIGLYVLKITGSAQSFGLTLMFGILPRILLGPLSGNWADRLNKKVIIVSSDTLSGILMAGLFFYSLNNPLNLPLIYGTTALLSISATFLSTAFQSAAVDIVKEVTLTRYTAVTHSAFSLIELLAPVVGGIVFALVPMSVFLMLNGLSFLLSALSELFIDFNYNAAAKAPLRTSSFFDDLIDGFKYFLKDRLLLNIALMALFLNFFLTSVSVVLPYGIIEVRNITEQVYGIIMAIISLGSFAGALLVGKLDSKFSKRHLVLWLSILAMAFSALGFTLHPGIQGNLIPIIGLSFFGFILSASATSLNIPLGVFIQTSVDRNYLGRVVSIIQTTAGGITPIAFILFGALTERVSPFAVLLGSSIITLAIVIFQANSKRLDTISKGLEPQSV